MAIIEIRLTTANLSDLHVGDILLDGGEDLGPLRSARVTNDGYENARIYGEYGDDILGLPSTVCVERDA